MHRGTIRSAAVLMWVVVAGLSGGWVGRATAQMYYAEMTATENAEVVAWSVHYWSRVENGGGAPGEGFAFTNPLMNSQVFNPIRSARPTLEQLGSFDSSRCDRLYELPAGLDAGTVAARSDIRDLMLYGEIVTEAGSLEDWQHLLLALTIPSDVLVTRWMAGLWTYVDVDGFRYSVDLPLIEVSEEAASASLALEVSTESEQVISSLLATGGYWRSQCSDVPQWKSLITGDVSTAEQFKGKVDEYFALQSVSSWTVLMQANFGSFGELPIVTVFLSDCYFLMDATNGNLSGPFAVDSPLDASGLLTQHSGAYQAGSAIRYYTKRGASAVATGGVAFTDPCEDSTVTGKACAAFTDLGAWGCDAGGQSQCRCRRIPGQGYGWDCKPCEAGKSCFETTTTMDCR